MIDSREAIAHKAKQLRSTGKDAFQLRREYVTERYGNNVPERVKIEAEITDYRMLHTPTGPEIYTELAKFIVHRESEDDKTKRNGHVNRTQ